MERGRYWLVYAVDDGPVQCDVQDSALDLAVAASNLLRNYRGRVVYLYCFYGERLYITKGPERCLVVPHHDPSHYQLFSREGEITDIEESGLINPEQVPEVDSDYKHITEEELIEDEPEPEDDLDAELTEPSKEHEY